MKKLFLLLGAMMTFFGAQTANAQSTFVDLGLPSGTLWATCNVGADSPEDWGDYFAWGETSSKISNRYTWSQYKYCWGSQNTMTKYCTESSYGYDGLRDNLTELLPEDDAATVNWGEEWQMPSIAQFEELINSNYTTIEDAKLNNVPGKRITSKSNGKSIFLPLPGWINGSSGSLDSNERGHYWTRSLDTSTPKSAQYCFMVYGYPILSSGSHERFCGLAVRPVRVQDEHTVYNIPEGWKVNGTTPSGTYQAKGGDVLYFTPKNIPSGKKIKSIKVVKK